MSAPIIRGSFQSDLLPIINDWHGDDLKMQEDIVAKIMSVQSSESAFEIDGMLLPFSTFQKKGEGQTTQFDSSRQLYTPRFNHDTWSLGFVISMELMQDGKLMKEARRFTKLLTKSKVETDNILAVNVLNNGFTAGKTQDGGDGAILFSNAHPSPVGNQSNIITTNAALSEASLEALYIQMRNATDDRGIRINLRPRKIVVNPQLEPALHRILNSNLRVGTTNNDPNFLKDTTMFPEGMVSTPYLTSTTAYIILTDLNEDQGLRFYKRYDSDVIADNVFDTQNMAYQLIMRRSAGWINYKGAYGAQGQ